MSNNIYGYGESTGPYFPSAAEQFYGTTRRSAMDAFMNYAFMNNARAQAARDVAARAAFGGPADVRNERLFNSKAGAGIRQAAGFAENLYGTGSYVDMAGGLLNISSSAGFGVGSFGRGPVNMYGAGPVSDVVAQRLFTSANKYFSNANGSDNVMRTQGADMTSVSRTMQILANSGRYAGTNIANVKSAKLEERLTSAAANLRDVGDTTSADKIDRLIKDSGGDTTKLKSSVENMANSDDVNGQLKKELQVALSSKSVVKMEEPAVNKMLEETTQMLKVIGKVRSAFGDMSEMEAVRTAGTFTSGRLTSENDIHGMNAAMNKMSALAEANGMTSGEFGQRAMLNNAVLTQIYGSSAAAGVSTLDYTNRLITNQRLNNGGVRTSSQVEQSFAQDVAGVNQESNIIELKRLAYAAQRDGDPGQIAKASEAIEAVTGTLDPSAQAQILGKLREDLGNPTVALTSEEINNALPDSALGKKALNSLTDYANLTKERSYDVLMMKHGFTGTQAEQFRKLKAKFGSGKLTTLASASSEDITKMITDAGLNPEDFKDIISEEGIAKTKGVMTDAKYKGQDMVTEGEEELESRLDQERIAKKNQYTYGSDRANIQSGKSLLRLGLDAIVNKGRTAPSSRDIMDYALTTEKYGTEFSIDDNDSLSFENAEEKNAFLDKASNGDPDVRKRLEEALEKEKNLTAVGEILEEQGGTIGLSGKDGRIMTQKDMEDAGNALRGESLNQVYSYYGVETDLGKVAMSPEKEAEEKARLFKEISIKASNKYGELGDYRMTDEDFANRGAGYLVYNSLMEKGVDGEDPEAVKSQAVMAMEALNSGAVDKQEVLKNVGWQVANSDDFENWRKDLRINFSEEQREKWTEDGTAAQLAEIMLATKTGQELTSDQNKLLEKIRTEGSGGGQAVQNMTVTNFTVLND
jgi:hypothetical protein